MGEISSKFVTKTEELLSFHSADFLLVTTLNISLFGWYCLQYFTFWQPDLNDMAIKMQNIFFGSSCPELNCKKDLLLNFVNVTKNTCLGVSFKESCRPILATWLCKELDDSVFQWILRTVFQDSYCITPLEGYFCFMDLFLIMMVWNL